MARTWIGKSTPSVVLGAVSLLPSLPERGDAPLGDEGHGGRVQARPWRRRRPRAPARRGGGVTGAHHEDVAGADATPCSRSAASRSSRKMCSPGSSQRTPRRRGTSSSTPRPTSPSRSTSIASDRRALGPSPRPPACRCKRPPVGDVAERVDVAVGVAVVVDADVVPREKPSDPGSSWPSAVMRWSRRLGVVGAGLGVQRPAQRDADPVAHQAAAAATRSGVRW